MMRSRSHRNSADLAPNHHFKWFDKLVDGQSRTDHRHRKNRAASLIGIVLVIAGVWIAQFGSPWRIHHEGFDQRFKFLLSQPTEVMAAFTLMIFGAVVLGLLTSKRLEPLEIADHLPGIQLKESPTGIALIVLSATTLAFLCFLVSAERGVFWYPVLLVASFSLLAAGVRASDATPIADSPKRTFNRTDLLFIVALATVVIWAATRGIADWYFAWIGDEGAFFLAARYIAQGAVLNIFDLTWVYETHPLADSIYQSIFLRLFGEDVVGWRLAEVAVAAIAAVLVYLIFVRLRNTQPEERTLSVRLPAVIGALVLGTSAFTMAFCHIGYNNLHGMVPPLLVMLILTWMSTRPRAVHLLVLGGALGLCLYTFLAATLIWIVLAIYLLLGIRRAPLRTQITALILIVAGFAAVALPALLTNPAPILANYQESHSAGFGASDFEIGTAVNGLARTLISFWHNEQWFRHHVTGPLLSPVGGALVIIGLVAALVAQRRSSGDRFLLLWFSVGTVVIAFTNYTEFPSYTRLHFVMPAVALLACRGAMALIEILRNRLHLSTVPIAIILLFSISLIPTVHLHRLHNITPQRLPAQKEALTIRALQEYPGRPVIDIAPEIEQNRELMVSFYPWYEELHSWIELEDLESAVPSIDPDAVILVYDEKTAQTVTPLLRDRWRQRRYPDPDFPHAIWIFTPSGAD